MMRDARAVHASPTGLRIPHGNVGEFLFANPFCGKDALAVATAPPALRGHCLKERVPPHKPLYISAVSGAEVSWERVRRDAGRVARGLRALPFLQPPPFHAGQDALVAPVVMVQLPNNIVYAPVCFGIWAAGLTASTVNPFLTRDELAHVLRQSRPQAIVTLAGPSLHTLAAAVDTLGDASLKEHYRTAGCIFVVDAEDDDYGATRQLQPRQGVADWQVRNWKWLLGRDQQEWPIAPMSERESKARIALVMWSSGTSGKSKGVALSHYALIWQMAAFWHAMVEFGPDERFLGLPPVYHSFGITVLLMMAPLIGASVVMIPKFDLKSYLELASTFRATVMHVAPPVALLLAKSPLVDKYNLSTVKRALCGGAPLGPEIIQQVYKRTGIMVTMGLGMTETAGGTAQQCGLSWEEMQSAAGSTGRFMLGMDAKLVDEDDKVVKIGEPGEILLRSPMNFTCYLNDPDATKAAITQDGWYRSGDVGVLDKKGNIYIVDRLKDVIKYKGLQVAPAELEGIICACPLVKDAGVCATFSAEEATELPRAYVVPADPSLATCGRHATKEQRLFADEVRRHVEKHTVKYKWLRGGIVIVREIPTSPSGKRLRKLLKQMGRKSCCIHQQQNFDLLLVNIPPLLVCRLGTTQHLPRVHYYFWARGCARVLTVTRREIPVHDRKLRLFLFFLLSHPRLGMPARARSNTAPTRASARIKAAPPKPEPKPAPAARPKRKATDEQENENTEAKTKRGRPKKDDVAPLNGHKPKKLPAISPDNLNQLPHAAEHLRPARHIFVFGDTDGFPQLGLGADTTSISRPRLHAWVKEAVEEGKLGGPGAGFEIVCSGAMHTLAIDEAGRIWSWGINDEGQLGRLTNDVANPEKPGEKLDKDELEATPALVEGVDPNDFRAVRIAAGGSVSVALSDEGEVRSWGSFKWDGLLGFDSGAPGPTRQFTPQFMPDLARYRFVSVACGQDHVLALTTTGIVFSWGNGEDSQLGRRILDRRRRNALMADRLALRHIVYISAGHSTSFAMDKDGVVYAWGLNGYGQTGIDPEDGGNADVIEHPTRVKALHPFVLGGRRVAQIVSANAHTLWRLDDGTLYGCGRNDEAQLGLGPDHPQVGEARIRTPIHIRLPNPPTPSEPNPTLPPYSADDATGPQATKVVSVAASGWHNLAVSDGGNVYCWGWGANHQLGLGPSAEKQLIPTMIKNTALNSGWKIVDAATGSHHGILVAVKPETD